jgi:hypothetical protein
MSLIKVKGSSITGSLPAIDGSALTGISGGKILQVQSYRKDSDRRIQSGNSEVVHDNIVITPADNNNKILFLASATIEQGGNTGEYVMVKARRVVGGTTSVIGDVYNALGYNVTGGTRGTLSFISLDDPQTTSQVTYQLYHENDQGSGTYDYYETNYTLMEISV